MEDTIYTKVISQAENIRERYFNDRREFLAEGKSVIIARSSRLNL